MKNNPQPLLTVPRVSVNARTEFPAFIGDSIPRFSWNLASDLPDAMQTSYRILAGEDAGLNSLLWDSGTVSGSRSLNIPWEGPALTSRREIYFQIQVKDNHGNQAVSPVQSFEIALLDNSDWQGRWIYNTKCSTVASSPAGYFRKEFRPSGGIVRARLYISALGLFEPYLNGRRIGEDLFAPGWSDYNQSRQYCCYDVTELIRKDAPNALGVILGEGWYCGYIGCRTRNNYGKYPKLLCQLELTGEDGSRRVIASDESWKTAFGPIGISDIYDGENYDARFELPGWNQTGADEQDWDPVAVSEDNAVPLMLKKTPPVKVISEIQPVRLLNPKKNVYIWDFGQNITGNIRIRFTPNHSYMYSFSYAEMLDEDGLLYNLNYRSARSRDYFTGAGKEVTWSPKFTFHGFRYLQIDGFQFAGQSPEDMQVTALEIHTDMPLTAEFESGNPLLNQLFSNICWGAKDNFLEIPTDCPQRDERLGWTGDACVFAATATRLMNCSAFFQKYLFDMREAQLPGGAIPLVVPNVWKSPKSVPVWADSIVNIPWVLYKFYGDKQILRDNFPAMLRHLEFSRKKIQEPEDNFIGDWLSLSKIPTPREYIRLVMLFFTADIIARTAEILHQPAEKISEYRSLRDNLKKQFAASYLSENKLTVGTQTACVLAIQFGLLTPEQLKINGDYLAELIREDGQKLNTGFVGTAWLLRALSLTGHDDTAYALLQEEGYPSWLYSVKQGATTIWERWNSYSKEEGFGDVNMNSFNHYAYGAVGEWMLSHAGGISCDHTREIPLRFKLNPDPRLNRLKVGLMTPYGPASSRWQYDGDHLSWDVAIPANTTAEVLLPDHSTRILGSGNHHFQL